MESRSLVMGHDYFGAVDECMRSLSEVIVVFKWQFVSPVVLHDAHIASVALARVNSSASDSPPVSCLVKTILLLAAVAAV